MTDRRSHDAKGEKDQVKPFHAKDVTTGQETAEVVAAVLKHAAERDEAARKKAQPKGQPKWMLPLGLNLGVLAVYLLIAPPSWVVVNPIAPPATDVQTERLRTGMYMEIRRIEGFLAENGRLPASLTEAGSSAGETLDYTVRGSQYLLVATLGEEAVVFDSSVHEPNAWVGGDLSGMVGG